MTLRNLLFTVINMNTFFPKTSQRVVRAYDIFKTAKIKQGFHLLLLDALVQNESYAYHHILLPASVSCSDCTERCKEIDYIGIMLMAEFSLFSYFALSLCNWLHGRLVAGRGRTM
jgi:hypothetical protein